VGGQIDSDGGNEILERGICYSLEALPDTSDAFATTGEGDLPFSEVLTGLEDGATYFARAYAINDMGIGYGNEISFQTPLQGLPAVITLDASQIAATSVSISGNVTSEGDAPVTIRGVFYSTEPLPDANDVVITSGSGSGLFTCNVESLQESTLYFARAFATNSIGTVFGNEVSFSTSIGAIVSLECDATFAVGNYTPGVAVSNGSLNLVYSGGNGGSYNAQTINSTGVAGLTASLASGNFVNGSGNLLLNISGIPQTNGNAIFSISIGGQNCSFSLPVEGGSIGTLNCDNPVLTGEFVEGIEVSNGSVTISYANAFGSYNSQSIFSTGVTGLLASLNGDDYSNGTGSLNFVITGIPQSTGIASFSLSIGGQECSFDLVVQGASVEFLNCSNAVITGDFFDGVSVNNASISISYSSGIGNYDSQVISSTGVNGLSATLASGTFLSGGGSIQLIVTGTPSQPGLAIFSINIGGQNCVLQLTVSDLSEHTCGTPGVHNSSIGYSSMFDQQGNVYKTIIIGNQEWMAENLTTSIYRNGDEILSNLNNSQWAITFSGAWAFPSNNPSYECPFGKLYNWYACVESRQLCPVGWHVPSEQDWIDLANSLGGIDVAGGKLKSNGNGAQWQAPNFGASNSAGFSGVPSGGRNSGGPFSNIGTYGYWWTSSNSITNPIYKSLYSGSSALFTGNIDGNSGFAVRCIRD
jgi:uncharacterized protein (TIGR02145 family)